MAGLIATMKIHCGTTQAKNECVIRAPEQDGNVGVRSADMTYSTNRISTVNPPSNRLTMITSGKKGYEAMETIIEMMIREKIASNQWQASHISEGLQLHLCHTREEQVKRCKLYRDWRNAGEDSATAYRRAKNGDPVPQSLFDGVLHSDTPSQDE
jgi:hypothetical protein